VQAAADIMISADGKFLYASNRADPFGEGENSIAVYKINEDDGSLKAIQWAFGGFGPKEGLYFPRHSILVPFPGEPILAVAN
jgi:6-phosphogluconolactonase (cycloisomerase 2 family)